MSTGRRRGARLALAVLAVTVALVAASCSSDAHDGADPATTATTQRAAATSAPASTSSIAATVPPATTAASAASPAAVVAAPSTGCASPIAPPRGTQQRVDVAGAARPGWYLRYVPAVADLTTPAPLVLDLHGYLEGAQIHTATSGMSNLADRHGFVLVSPQGTGTDVFWNHRQRPEGPPDVAFLASVLDAVEHDLCIDRTRVYVVGYSNGAFMTSTLGCVMTDRLAAIAPVAGARFDAGCTPSRPLPVLAFHGTADPIVAFAGGDSASGASLDFDSASAANFTGDVNRPVLDSLADWAEVDGCDAQPTRRPASAHVVLVQWACPTGQEVVFYEVTGGGHSWPGSAFSAAISDVIGPTTMEIDASELIWEFFAAHRRADPAGG